MSVNTKEMGDSIQEKLGIDGKVIRSRGPVKDYALVEEAVQQFKALLAEQTCSTSTPTLEFNDSPDVPTVECDLQGPHDDVEANFGLQPAPGVSKEEFIASMKPDFVYQEGNKIYTPAYKDSNWKYPFKGKNGTVEWRAEED
ncbi:unnamed protein product [Alternaria alternata]